MRRLPPALAVVAALTVAACGGDGDEAGDPATRTRGEATAPAAQPDRTDAGEDTTPAAVPDVTDTGAAVTRAEFDRCVEREGLEVYEVDERIPGVEGGRLEVGTESAEQIAVLWPESKHVIDVFVAEDAAAADRTEAELVRFFSAFGLSEEQAAEFVQRTGNVIVTPDDDGGPDAEELAVLRGCLG